MTCLKKSKQIKCLTMKSLFFNYFDLLIDQN